jgi:hypothetical protein
VCSYFGFQTDAHKSTHSITLALPNCRFGDGQSNSMRPSSFSRDRGEFVNHDWYRLPRIANWQHPRNNELNDLQCIAASSFLGPYDCAELAVGLQIRGVHSFFIPGITLLLACSL